MKNKKIIMAIVAFILILLAYMYIIVPPLNPLIKEGASFISFILVAIGLAIFVFRAKTDINEFTSFRNVRIIGKNKKYILPAIFVITPIAFYIVVAIIAMPLFTSEVYKNQLGDSTEKVYKEDVELLDIDTIPVVDKELATRLADRKLGEKTSLGSQVILGEPTIQKYKGKLVWAVPLEHSGFFKWLSNMQGTPGYILISATDQRDVTFVEGHNIKYQFGAYFNDDLLRKARFSGSLFDGLMDYSFEIDEDGVPYYIVTTYVNKLGLSLKEATGAIIINATTGMTSKYNINDIPEWVDRIQPEEIIIEQINNKGEYINGVFNFSNKDKFRTSPGNSIIYNNGKCYLFTGLTSVGADEAANGFIMVDMRTKESIIYKMSGATEYAATKSAEGKVQHLGYTATFPLITNINGVPTYFMALKDKEGLIKQYAFVSIDDYTTVGTGETKETALINYEKELRTNNNENPTEKEFVDITGKVYRIANEVQNNILVYKIILEDNKEKIYTAMPDISEYLAFTKDGDEVKLSCSNNDSNVVKILKFENISIK